MNISQADCRAIFDAVSDAILIHDVATGEILEVNRGMCGMFGYTPEEARRLKVTALCGGEPGSQPETALNLLAKAAAGSPQVFEWQARDRAGRVFWVEVHLKPIRLRGRDRVLAVLRDIDRRKRAEEALQESEARYRVVTEGSLAGVYIIQDGGFVYVNPTMAQIFGYQPEEMISGAVEPRDLIHPEDLPLVQENIRRRLSGELEAAHYTFRGLNRDGAVIHCESFGRAVEYQGRPAIVGTLLDITERQMVEEALRESEASYRIVTEGSLGGVYLIQDGKFRYVNPVLAQAFGYTSDELIDRLGPSDLVDPEDRDRILGVVERRLAGEGVPSRSNFKGLCKDGSVIHVETLSRQVEYHGRPAVMGTLLDATERKHAEEALRETTHALQTLIQASPLAIIALDLKGRVISWNPAAERMFGWSQAEVMGRPLPTIPPGQEQAFQAQHQLTLQGIPLLGLELRRQRRDGSLIDIRLSTASLYDGAGAMTGIMGIIEDITEPKRLEERLRQVSRALKAITECHQALIRATDERELLNEVCRIIVEVGGYRMAWVGCAEHDAHKSVRPVAQTGFDADYVEQLNLTWADKERGRGPTGKAIRRGKPVICRDTQVDPGFAFMAEEARIRGYASVLALPLNDSHTFGALTIYAADPNTFDDEEINLLLGLANDLAYGIVALRGRAEQRRVEEALKESKQELRGLTSQLMSIQEQERRRVARELHDELGQALTVLKINLVAIEDKLAPDQQPLKVNCEHMLSYIDTVIENVRRLSWDLSPSSLEDLGLSAALGYLAEETCRNHDMQCAVVMDEIDHLFAPEIQINIYRIFQESLTNVVKHARAGLVSVNITREDGKVSFMIRDNGRGFNLNQIMSGKVAKRSLGLTAMNERALMARGSLQISSRRGQGTTITFSIPIDNHVK
ncbi:MAG: PAS domain S-box protein [Deltaproteobacteria bacterium]|nr:PAS domain S-box protein [Deltaproteobacteria bacterium]